MKLSTSLLAGALALALAGPASASLLLGETVRVTYDFPVKGNAFQDFGNHLVGTDAPIDFSGVATLTLNDATGVAEAHAGPNSTWTAVAFNGFHIFDIFGTISDFTSVNLTSTTVSGFTASRITFDADNIYINWQGLDQNGAVNFSINSGPQGPIPEPATWAMMILGFGASGAMLRRRRTALAT